MRRLLTPVVAAALLATAGCKDTVWPSDADQQEFCDKVTSFSFTELGVPDEDLERLGTPANLPHEARRYLLDLAEGSEPEPEGEAAFVQYVADYC